MVCLERLGEETERTRADPGWLVIMALTAYDIREWLYYGVRTVSRFGNILNNPPTPMAIVKTASDPNPR